MRQLLFNIALLLVVVGALNWGLHTMNINLVEMLGMGNKMVENVVYYAVAIAGLYLAYDVVMNKDKFDLALKA